MNFSVRADDFQPARLVALWRRHFYDFIKYNLDTDSAYIK